MKLDNFLQIDHESVDEGAFTDDDDEDTELTLSPLASASNFGDVEEEISVSPVISTSPQETEGSIISNSTQAESLLVRRYKDSYSESSSGSDFGESKNVLDDFSTKDPGSYYFYQGMS